ncbi:MAG: heavy metal translocating P-type ATPase [Eubacterium sp.]|nr:heavy metal translocating P-type ATPase [Eubacterium sp.]
MTPKQKKNLIRCIIAFILVVGLSILFAFVKAPVWCEFICYLIPYFIVGIDVLIKAFKNIRNGQVFDECFLMTIATVGAIATGEYREGVAVMLFYQVGELFQSIAVGRSRKNIADLMDICPDTANLLQEDGSISEEDPDDIEIGSIIVVNPGEKVPIDGIVIEGEASIDASALTGESVPRSVREGDQIISGCISITGQLKIRTEKEFGESTVSKILDMVENSSMKKAKAENFISRFAKYYTPIVCYSALALAVIPPIIRLLLGMEANWVDWIMRALTFLVISCPCAVVISVPLSFFGGIGCASSRGILVKGSNYLEILADTSTIVFDKTGTLTKGVFEVHAIYPSGDYTSANVLEAAAYAESASNHPISISIKRAYTALEAVDGIDTSLIHDVENVPGFGVSASVIIDSDNKNSRYNRRIYAGNLKYMDKLGIEVKDIHDEGTEVYVAIDTGLHKSNERKLTYAGCIIISDAIKSGSKEAMDNLKAQGIKTIMLTGDTERAARAVAEEIGVSEFKAGLLPGDKVSEVEKLLDGMGDQNSNNKDSKNKLAFVGDGINDAPVLARADIGIAMGGMGSDAAIEAADIVLMDDDPSKISLAMKISRKTLGIVRQNITFAIGVKVLCLILGALGLANMWLAIFADVGVMVIAVLNATRTLKIKA